MASKQWHPSRTGPASDEADGHPRIATRGEVKTERVQAEKKAQVVTSQSGYGQSESKTPRISGAKGNSKH